VIPFKGRCPKPGTRVHVYRNLGIHGEVAWSVRDAKTRLVVAVVPEAIVAEATLRVSESGRKRVLREKQKNVHAYVEGLWAEELPASTDWAPIRYNPYNLASFVRTVDQKPVRTARAVRLDAHGAFAADPA
jgi:hypothetical protein